MDIRKTALSLLRDAEQNDKYVSLSLSALLDGAECDERDRALLTTLVYGVTERRVTLDYYIEKLAGRPCDKIGARLLMTLRLGLYQLMFLDRIPPHAAVSETVRLGKSQGERAFLNGVLRGYLRDKEKIVLPDDFEERLSVKYSFPKGIVALMHKNLGDKTEEVLHALSKNPPITICINTLVMSVGEALEKLTLAGFNAKACETAPRGIMVFGNVSFKTLCSTLGENAFFVQDEASQIAISVLAPAKGATLADACACPGSKSFHAAVFMENLGEIHCYDLHESKLSLVESGAKRLGIDIISASARDSRNCDEKLIGKCDFVICDVPCSGLGVMAKKPEIRYHDASLYKELAPLGFDILSASAKYLKSGGRMLYSTCTLTKEENEDNFYRFLSENKGFKFVDFSLGEVESTRGCATLLPNGFHDGFFIGLIEKD
ncbi:MAG: 16S rRNA (cytosine(967)-C(5))-methyltransferase RsmB [Ruminococcaceae bacterium]|nr:16S rRNA (cytosine(967)-C(5))-methyltransferase RsmB [Oscillospiraceae bacterium]